MISKKKRLTVVLFCCLILTTTAASSVHACSCINIPYPPCRAVGEADAIFDGTVLKVEKVELDTNLPLRRRFTIKVKNVYKGSLERVVSVYTGVGDSDCGYRFKVGKRYLIYGDEEEGRVSTGICTRTQKVKDAAEDISFLSQLASMPSGARIFGTVKKVVGRTNEYVLEGFPGIPIEIEGASKATIVTDSSGYFSVQDLPAGRYRVKAAKPEGFTLSAASMVDLYPWPLYDEEIGEKGCLETLFVFEPAS